MSGPEEDAIWNSSRTAQQIHDLGRVENVPTHPVHPHSFTANASSRTSAASSPSRVPLSLSSPSPRPTRQTPGSRRATSAASNSLPKSANTLRPSTCVLPPSSFLRNSTGWRSADHTNGAPLLPRTHPCGTYLTRGPHSPASRVRPATAGHRAPCAACSWRATALVERWWWRRRRREGADAWSA